mgnify:CR=1 FL=1
MKRFLIATSITAFCLITTSAIAGTITGTSHDFSGETWTTEICQACHAPHNNKDTSGLNDLLWNHEITAASYTLYTGLDLQGTIGQPDGISKLCLSCHDGTVAVDSFGTHTATAGAITGAANFGTDLSNDHPISITYDTADLELNPTTTTVDYAESTATNETIAEILEGGATGTVECSSCHDVHNSKSDGNNLLLVTNTNSALCLTCHAK